MRRTLATVLALVAFAWIALPAFAGEPAPAAPAKPVVLGNATCPVTGEPADAETNIVWNGLEVRFCCPACIPTFRADPAKYAPALLRDLASQLAAARASKPTAADPQATPAAKAGGATAPAPGGCQGSCGGECPGRSGGTGASPSGGGEGGACEGTCPATGKKGPAPHGPMGSDAPAPSSGGAPAPAPSAPEVVDLGNATCPVMEGRPVRAGVTGTWRNLKVHYCCAGCDARFQKDPEAYLAKMAAADPEVARRIEGARAAWAKGNAAK